MTVVLAVVGALILLVLIALAVSYNRFVRQRNLVAESWRQVDVELQRRHDLVPDLVATVRGYADHEREVFELETIAPRLDYLDQVIVRIPDFMWRAA